MKEGWYINGKLHREGGPAITYNNGIKVWCKNGDYHREDGPAMTGIKDGLNVWWLYDKSLYGVEEWFEENGIDKDNMLEEDIVAFKLKFS